MGTGNNARRGEAKSIKVMIKKVARVFITIEQNGYDQKYRISSGGCYEGKRHIQDDHNGGYYVFDSQTAVFEHEEINRIAGEITSKYPYQRDFTSLDFETIKKVAELLAI